MHINYSNIIININSTHKYIKSHTCKTGLSHLQTKSKSVYMVYVSVYVWVCNIYN